MAEEAEIISLAPEPRLCYYFVTTETTLGKFYLSFQFFLQSFLYRWIFIGSLVERNRRNPRR